MRIINILLLAGSAALVGCSKFQYATIRSDMNAGPGNEYVFENDSLVLRYSFAGINCPAELIIENKLNIPLYVDWQRSALIVNGESEPFVATRSEFKGTADGYAIHLAPSASSITTDISGSLSHGESIGFIAPVSRRKTIRANLDSEFFRQVEGAKQQRISLHTSEGPVKAYRSSFTKETSPLRFRVYLTISADPDREKVFVHEETFWVGEILTTRLPPAQYQALKPDKNLYHKRKVTGKGIALGVASVGLIWIASQQPQVPEN